MYFITCIQKYEKKDNLNIDIGAYNTYGYFTNHKDAEDVVLQNMTDIQEGVYNFAIIEDIPEGLYSQAEFREFYKWDNEKREFYKLSNDIKEEKEIIDMLNDGYGNWAF